MDGKNIEVGHVAKHNTRQSCWVIIDGFVYDVTDFLSEHPGGDSVILSYAGKDATDEFNLFHPPGILESQPVKVKRIGWVATRATDNVAQDLDITRSRHTSNDQKYIPISLCINLSDFEQIARTKLSKRAWIYYSSTSEDSYTHSQNINDWKKVSFRPRVMRDVDSVTTTRLILGQHSAEPFFIAPAALARLGHPDGESCLARGATQYNIPYAMSTASSVPMEDLAAYFQADTGRGSIWFQLYVQREEADTRVLIRRARSLGFRALLITVDTAAVAPREEDDRYKLELALEQGNEPPTFFSQVPQENGRKPAYRAPYSSTLNWKDLVWIKEEWGGAGPIGLKGIATVEDTLLASQHGIDCVYLSNHGGRQLDGAPSSMRTLLEIRKKCPEILGHCQILMDGGVRRGSDIIKALCLGATAVGLGRPFMFALSAYGTDGVARAIQILHHEIETTMRLLGVSHLQELGPHLINTLELEWMIASGTRDVASVQTSARL